MYRKGLWLGMASVIAFSSIARGAVKLWAITPVLLIEAVLIFAWLWRTNNRGKGQGAKVKGTEIDRPVLIFLVLAVISFVFSIYKHDSFYALLRLLGYIGVYYLIVNEFDRYMIKDLINFVILLGSVLSIYGLLQYFGFLKHGWWVPQNFLASTYVNHNHFAGYLELVIPVTLGSFIKRAKASTFAKASVDRQGSGVRGDVIFLIVSSVVMIAAFMLTQSRGAWLSLIASFFIVNAVLFSRRLFDKKSFFVGLFIVVVATSFIYFGKDIIAQRIEAAMNRASGEASLETRLKIWHGTLDMIADNPFVGTGIGTFAWGFPRYRPEGLLVQANFAHNDYLQMAAEMGILAPLFMILIFGIASRAFLRTKPDSVTIGLCIGIFSLSLHGVVDFNFHIPANMILFVVWIGVVMKREL